MSLPRGLNAKRPRKIPPLGWWDILKRTYNKMQRDNLSLVAAGVAFYFLLALFPLLAGIISLYGLIVSVDDLQSHISLLIGIVPQDSRYILEEQLLAILQKSDTALSTGFLASFALTIWSGGKGAQALITACNITYSEPKGRGFFRNILSRLSLTLGIIVIVIVALLLITILPEWLSKIAGTSISDAGAAWITWPLVILIFGASLAALYRYGPNREVAKWRWVTPGSALATLCWVAASYGFSYYLSEYAKYNETYGSVGGIIILLMWFYLSAYIILLGAEFNSAMELQTRRDSTTGEPKPEGERGAYVADNSPKVKD